MFEICDWIILPKGISYFTLNISVAFNTVKGQRRLHERDLRSVPPPPCTNLLRLRDVNKYDQQAVDI